jgi:hypothetical protein
VLVDLGDAVAEELLLPFDCISLETIVSGKSALGRADPG